MSRLPRPAPAAGPVLAIVAPSFNQVSETFIADHVCELAPGASASRCSPTSIPSSLPGGTSGSPP